MVEIDFRLAGSGWAKCIIHVDGRQCELSTSYLSDALGKLVLAGIAILAGVQGISVGFNEEPGEYRWTIVMTGKRVDRLDVLHFQELWATGRTPKLGRC